MVAYRRHNLNGRFPQLMPHDSIEFYSLKPYRNPTFLSQKYRDTNKEGTQRLASRNGAMGPNTDSIVCRAQALGLLPGALSYTLNPADNRS